MKSSVYFLLLFLLLLSCSETKHPKELTQLVDEGLNFSLEQYKLMAQSLPDSTRLPRTTDPEDGSLVTSGTSWWCSGFFPGSLWYLYEYSGDSNILEEAKKRTAVLEKEKFNTGTHDLGFMLYNSFGNGYRLTGDPQYRDILITGAQSLVSRYNDTVGCIRSWNHGGWKFPVIIDNMMNLEYLYWATKVTGDSTYYNIAFSHTEKTIQNHFRDDWSTYHLVDFDPSTGEVIGRQTVQGAFDESAWARGQAWGFYGFTVAFRETGNEKYLEVAKGIADFILNHPNLPEDMVPYWDFNAPEIPDAKRDASSAAIISSALLELQKYVDEDLADTYLDAAEKMIRSLSSSSYRAEPGENNNFILMHGVGSLPGNSEVDVPLTYADYYYIESLMRFRSIKDSLSVRVTDEENEQSLRDAAFYGQLEQVQELLSHDTDVNAKDQDGHTALMLAAFNGHSKIVNLLIDEGADVDMRDAMGQTALLYASTGPFAPTVKILLKAGAEPNAADNNEHFTPLMHAAAEGQLEVVKLLLENGANPALKDIDGDDAQTFARQNGHIEVAELLSERL